MIVKGLIKSIDFSDNSCKVRIPLFETAASTGEVVLKATMLVQPGMYNGFIEGDVVFVDFENDDLGQPIIIGKLYLGAAQEAAATAHSALSVSNLEVTSKATLPIDTKIVVEDIGSTVPVENGITSYRTISDIIKALYRTETSTDQIYNDQSEMIANIVVEYLSQPEDAAAPSVDDPAWSISTPSYRAKEAIWQKTTCYNNRGQILSTEIVCLTAVTATASYRLRCTSKLHAATNQTEPITITAMVKLGSSVEVKDETAKIYYRWSIDDNGTNSELKTGPVLTLNPSDLKESNLLLTMKHGEDIYDTETIFYAPLNTPTLVLDSESASITYAANGFDVLGDPVVSNAAVYLNGDALKPDEVSFSWALTDCAGPDDDVIDPNAYEDTIFTQDGPTVTVSFINSRTRLGTAKCTATILREGAFKDKTYERSFTVAQTRVGEASTSYWLSSTCTVHMGKKHFKPIVATAMKQIGTDLETTDTDASIWWRYASETTWTEAVDRIPVVIEGKESLQEINYILTVHTNEIEDDDIIVLATHDTMFNPNSLTEAELLTDTRVYEREEFPFSPLNTPIINLTNDMGAFVCKSDGTKLNPADVTKTTAELWLNGSKITKDVSYKWKLTDCETDTGLSEIENANLTVKNIYADVATATCTATYKDEEYSKVFKVVKQYQGRSPYIIDIYNDFVSMPTTDDGEIPDAFLDGDLERLTTHTLSCYYGDETLNIESYSSTSPTQDDEKYRIKYVVDQGLTLDSTLNGPDFAISAVAKELSVGSIKYELYKGKTRVATAKFEFVKQIQGVSATSFWVSYSSRVHRGTNQQDDIKATAWSKFGDHEAVKNTLLDIRYGWRNSEGTFDYCADTEIRNGELTVPAVVNSTSNFKNADLLFELGTWDDETKIFTVTDSEVITYSPSNTPVLDLSNDRGALPYRTNGQKFGDNVATCIGTLYLDGQIITEGVTYNWGPVEGNNTVADVFENGALVGQKISVSELTSDTMEFICTATLNNKKLFKEEVTLSKVFTVSKQIQGEDGAAGVTYWLKLSNRVHLGKSQKNTITVTAMRKFGNELVEDVDESAILKYKFDAISEFWKTVRVPVAGETEKYETHCLTLNPEELPENVTFKDLDLLVKAYHVTKVEVDGVEKEQEVEYESETITYSPLNTPVLDLDNDTATILYPAKAADDLIEVVADDGTKTYFNNPLGVPVKSKATLYINGEAFADSDVEYNWVLTDCVTDIDAEDAATVVEKTSEVTVAAFAIKEDNTVASFGKATCTATVLAEGPYEGKRYKKTFTVSKTRKGNNAVVYKVHPDTGTIILDPNTGKIAPEVLEGICTVHDGDNTQPYGNTVVEYRFDDNKTATGDEAWYTAEVTPSGRFSIPLTAVLNGKTTNLLTAQCEIRLYNTAHTLLDGETVRVVKDGLNGVSVVSQINYYALIHNKYKADSIAAPVSDNELEVKNTGADSENPADDIVLKRLDLGEQNAETLAEWSITPPAHTDATNGWKYWTSVRTEFSSGAVIFSKPIISEDLSSIYALAQGKTTNYYGDADPSDFYSIKEGDCWFYAPVDSLGYTYTAVDEIPGVGYEHLYIDYYIAVDESNPTVFIEVTEATLDSLLEGESVVTLQPGKTKRYIRSGKNNSKATNTLYQWVGDAATGHWEDIGNEIVANKVTAQYVNALDITAKKIEILDTDNTTLFEADGLDGEHKVQIGGFEVQKNTLTTGSGVNLIKLSSDVTDYYGVRTVTSTELRNTSWTNTDWPIKTDAFKQSSELKTVTYTENNNDFEASNLFEFYATNKVGYSSQIHHYYAVTKVVFKENLDDFSIYLSRTADEDAADRATGDVGDYVLASALNPAGGIPNTWNASMLKGSTYGTTVNTVTKVEYTNIKAGDFFYVVYVHGSGPKTGGIDVDYEAYHNEKIKGAFYIPTSPSIRLSIGDKFQVLADGTVFAKSLYLGPTGTGDVTPDVFIGGEDENIAGTLAAVKIISGGENQKTSLNDKRDGIYVGPDGISIGANFKVTAGGEVTIPDVKLSDEQKQEFLAVSYWLASSCETHTGTKYARDIVVTAMRQAGDDPESIDAEAYLWWKHSTDTTWQLSDPHNYLTIPAAQIKDAAIQIIAAHKKNTGSDAFNPNSVGFNLNTDTTIYEREEIPFTPTNSPILDLTNDSAALTYKGNTKVGSNTADTTAALWLNGQKISSADVSYSWTFSGCHQLDNKTDTTASGASIKIKYLTADEATATCVARYNNEDYTKVFTIVKQLSGTDGDPSTSYWVNCSTPVHTGTVQTQPITVTAMRKVGTNTEEPDGTATLKYQYEGDGTSWTTATKTFTLSSLKDKNLIIEAYHGTTLYDTETVTYSPLNTPVLDLSNDNASIAYSSNTKLGSNVSSTAGIYLNGELISDQMEMLWLLTNCTADLGSNQADIKDADSCTWHEYNNQGLKQVINTYGNQTITIDSLTDYNAVARCIAFERLYSPTRFIYCSEWTSDTWSNYGQVGCSTSFYCAPGVPKDNYFVILGTSVNNAAQKHVLWYKSTGEDSEATGICVARRSFYEKDLTLTKQLKGESGSNGVSPVTLAIENEIDSIPCDKDGNISTDYDYLSKTLHKLRLVEGTTEKAFRVLDHVPTSGSGYTVVYSYNPDEIEAQLASRTTASSDAYEAWITELKTDSAKINYTVYKDTTSTVVAVGYFLAEKLRAGSKGDPGEATVDYCLLADAGYQVIKNPNVSPATYTPAQVALTAYKQVGQNPPVPLTTANRGDQKFFYTIGDGSRTQLNTADGKITLNFGADYYTTNQKVTLYLQEKIVAGETTTYEYHLLDSQTITVLSDGVNGAPGGQGGKGDDGKSVISTTKYYKLTNTTPSDFSSSHVGENPPDDGWKISPEVITDAKVEAGYVYWETIRTAYNDGTYSWSSPVEQSMLTVDFINALGITAKKITVTTKINEVQEDGTTKEVDAVLFSADGTNKEKPQVEMAGFKAGFTAQGPQLVSTAALGGHVTISPSEILLGGETRSTAPFSVTSSGDLVATSGELSGFVFGTELIGKDTNGNPVHGPVFKSQPAANALEDSDKTYSLTNPLYSSNWPSFIQDPSWVVIKDGTEVVTSSFCVYESNSFHNKTGTYGKLSFDTDFSEFTFYIASCAADIGSEHGHFMAVSNQGQSVVKNGRFTNGLAHTLSSQLSLADIGRTTANSSSPSAATTTINLKNSKVKKITLRDVKQGDYYYVEFVKNSNSPSLLDTGWLILPSQGAVQRKNRLYLTPLGSSTTIAGTGRNDWGLTVGENFGIALNGGLYASQANLTGTLEVDKATIGGIQLEDQTLVNGNLSLTSKNLSITGDQNSYLDIGIESKGSGTSKKTYPYLEFTNGGMLRSVDGNSGFMFTDLTYGSTTTFRLVISTSGSGTSVKVNGTLQYKTANGTWANATDAQVHPRKTFYVKVKGDIKSGFMNLGRTTVYAYATLTLYANDATADAYVSGTTDFNSVESCFFVSSTSDSATSGSNTSSEWTYTASASSTIISLGSIIPGNSANSANSWELCDLGAGDANRRWHYGYFDNLSFNNVDETSDRKVKNTIDYDVSKYDAIFDTLKPASYKYNNGTSGRTHLGFIAQDIQDSIKQANLTNKDCALVAIEGKGFDTERGEVINEEETRYSIRSNELHALEVRQIQLLKAQVKQQETVIADLMQRLEKLEGKN